MAKKRLLSGIQPTGKMHLGNYLGAVSNWVNLQNDYDSIFLIVDYHSLTSVYENPEQLRAHKRDLAIDLLSVGVDPEKCALCYQSDVPEHCELHLIFSMMTPLPWLTRVPTYKSKMDEIKDKDLNTYGFLGYPVLQAADILLYEANIVPVGQDQLPHLELTREIARRFNHLYKGDFPEPMELLTETPAIPGIDGRKMSKSYGNTIPVTASPDDIEKLVLKMLTDSNRVRRNDPGNPDICPVFGYHKLFSALERQTQIDTACRSAEIGCFDCKKECAERVIETLRPFYEKRQALLADPAYVDQVLTQGAAKARKIAQSTIQRTRQLVGL